MDTPRIKYVRAALVNSCVPACLAMITKKTLKGIIKDIYEHWEHEGRYEGVDDSIVDQYLSKNGYAIQRIHHEYEPNKLLIDEMFLVLITSVCSSDKSLFKLVTSAIFGE